MDSVADAFDFALKIDLNFKRIVSVKAWEQCSKHENMDTMITSTPPGNNVLNVRNMDTLITSTP